MLSDLDPQLEVHALAEQLAELLPRKRSGLLQQYVSLVELGKQNVTLTTAQALAKVVHQNVSDMLRRPTARLRRT